MIQQQSAPYIYKYGIVLLQFVALGDVCVSIRWTSLSKHKEWTAFDNMKLAL